MKLLDYILTQTGCKDLQELKSKLFKKRRNTGFDCKYSQIKCKGFYAFYTSNENHFCEYGITFKGVGMSSTYGIDADSITPAGRQRSCSTHYLNNSQLQTEVNL